MFKNLIHQHLIPYVDTKRLKHSLGQVKALMNKKDDLSKDGITLEQVLAYGFLIENELIQRGAKYDVKVLEGHLKFSNLLMPFLGRTVSVSEINIGLRRAIVFNKHNRTLLVAQLTKLKDKGLPAYDYATWEDVEQAFEENGVTLYNGRNDKVSAKKEYMDAVPKKAVDKKAPKSNPLEETPKDSE